MGAPKSQPLQPIAEDLASLFPLSVSSIIAPIAQCIHPQPEGCSGHPDLAMRWVIPPRGSSPRLARAPGNAAEIASRPAPMQSERRHGSVSVCNAAHAELSASPSVGLKSTPNVVVV